MFVTLRTPSSQPYVGGYAADLKLIFKFLLSFVEAFEEVLGGHFDLVRPTPDLSETYAK